MAATLLCVDDHEAELLMRKEILESCGYTVLAAADGFAAVEIVEQTPLSLVVLDYRMDGMDGEAIAKVLKSRHPHLPIVLLSAYDIPSELREMVDASISKGESPDVLIQTVRTLLSSRATPPASAPRRARASG
jgi:CheY-like chemotaxis protein